MSWFKNLTNLHRKCVYKRPTRCTNSYNVSLFIIKCSTCFHHQGQRSGAVHRNWYKPARLAVATTTARRTGLYQFRYTAPNLRSWWWTKESETCRTLNDKQRNIIRICASSWCTYIHIAIRCTVRTMLN